MTHVDTGVVVRTPNLNASLATASLEPVEPRFVSQQPAKVADIGDTNNGERGEVAVPLRIGSVRGSGTIAERIERERVDRRLMNVPEELVRRVPELALANLETMATAGVFGECFGMDRRQGVVGDGRLVGQFTTGPAGGDGDRRPPAQPARHLAEW